jgi:CheY-like chemotaxis protein
MPQTSTTAPELAPASPKRILVVEDDVDLASCLADVLETSGYEVALAAHGREAVDRLLAGDRPDLILLDVMMPVMDGWGFRAAQREIPGAAAIPVIAVTADGDARGKAAALHADGVLAKPVALAKLLAEIERVARRT